MSVRTLVAFLDHSHLSFSGSVAEPDSRRSGPLTAKGLRFQVAPTDLVVIIGPAIALAVGAVLATLPPVIRAARTNPVQALRE